MNKGLPQNRCGSPFSVVIDPSSPRCYNSLILQKSEGGMPMLALSQAELTILDWIAAHCRTLWLDVLFPIITSLGDKGLLWIVLALILLAIPSQRSTGVQVALALVFSALLCNLILKNVVDRIRPFELAGIPELLVALPDDSSFPSGHTSASFAVVTALMRDRHFLRWPCLVLAVLIALSRLYLYVHFPTDVAAGALLGILCGWIAVTVWRRRLSPWYEKRRGRMTPDSR